MNTEPDSDETLLAKTDGCPIYKRADKCYCPETGKHYTGLFEMIVGVLTSCHTQIHFRQQYVVAPMDLEILSFLL